MHSYFLSRPACIGLAISQLSGAGFSIAAHAKDIYVESGALRFKAEKAGFIVCCTASGQKYLQERLKKQLRSKVYLNYHGIERCYVKRKDGTNAIKVLGVGRLIRKKGFDNLIRAMAIVVKKCPAATAEIIGDGYQQRELKELAARLGIEGKVCFSGAKSHKQTLKAIGEADILAVASVIDNDGDRDGIANVAIEAFANGCSVVASGLEAMREAVINEQTGLLVRPGQVDELADAILRLANDKQLRRNLTERAYQFVKENFDSYKNGQQLMDLFQGGKICRKK